MGRSDRSPVCQCVIAMLPVLVAVGACAAFSAETSPPTGPDADASATADATLADATPADATPPDAAPALFVRGFTTGGFGPAANVTLNRPAATQPGDLLVVILAWYGTLFEIGPFVKVVSQSDCGDAGARRFLWAGAALATATDAPSFTFSSSNTSSFAGVLVALAGAKLPLDDFGGLGSPPGVAVAPSVTVQSSLARVITAFFSEASTSWPAPAGFEPITSVTSHGELALFVGSAPKGQTSEYALPPNITSECTNALTLAFGER